MKNFINYYYNLIPKSIHQKDKNYYFETDEENFLLLPCDLPNINDIYELSNSLLMQNIPIHQLIPNINKTLLTPYNGENYVLMHLYVTKKNIQLSDILHLNTLYIEDKIGKLKQPSWYQLWTNKVDYFEYQMSQVGKKYPLLVESFSYYVGLAENAIELVSIIKNDKVYYTLSHRRITYSSDNYDLYNPLNLTIDIRVRDICDYLKSCFFEGKDITFDIEEYLKNNSLSEIEKGYFMARMLFPTYYFDVYEQIISGKTEEKEILKVISKVNNYEQFLKTIYTELQLTNGFPEIEWLKKVIQY